MKKKSKIIIAISLLIVAICFILVAPWLLIIIIPGAVGIWWGAIEDKLKKSNSASSCRTKTEPLSVVVNNDIQIMEDCVKILNTSSNLQTVVHRYDDLIAVLKRLCEYEGNPAVSFPRELPSDALARITSEKAQIMNCAIQRAYDDVLHKCAALKTEKGRKNRQIKFFDEINALMDYFPDETRDFAIDFINQNIDDPMTNLEGL